MILPDNLGPPFMDLGINLTCMLHTGTIMSMHAVDNVLKC